MKKISLYFLALFFSMQATSQVLYLETFDNISGPTAGGAGTYNFPANMLLRNVDNLTPDPSVAYVNEAWERREDFSFNVADSCAFSTSWYSPVGAANDFMWTPGIALPVGGNVNLTWNAVTYDDLFPDGYEVRVMTVPPTGGAGDIGNQLTNSTAVFSITAENTVWTARTVSLSAYAGQTVYIGFRNNSNNQFLLLIDDIKVEAIVPFDASVTAGTASEYSIMPLNQASIPLGGTVTNLGTSALTNVNLHAAIYDASNVLVTTLNSTSIPTLATGSSATFSMPSYTPTAVGTYSIRYYHSQTEIDPMLTNDTLTTSIIITDYTFARDNGIVVGALGIGAGNGGYIGQSFTLTNPAYLYSIFAFYNVGYTGENMASVIWNTNGAGEPTTILASTDTLQYPGNNALGITIPISGGTVLLPAGTYVVTSVEFDSTVQLATTDEIFTTGKGWVNWPTSPSTPIGGWLNVESFGTVFAKAFILRMNLGATAIPLASEALLLSGKGGVNQNELTWTNNETTDAQYIYQLEKSTDLKSWVTIQEIVSIGKGNTNSFNHIDNNNANAKNYYRVKVSDVDNKLKYSNMVTLFNSNSNTVVELYPNPAKQFVTINMNNYSNALMSVYDLQGKLVLSQKMQQSSTNVSLKGIASGVYQVKISNANEVLFTEKLVVE